MKIIARFLTCSARAASLTRTLDDFERTDWPDAPGVCVDRWELTNRKESQTRNSFDLMNGVRHLAFDYLLFLEDDLDFNLHLHHNLQAWQPLRERVPLATLYDSGREGEVIDKGGSQALLISKTALEWVLEDWYSFTTEMQDLRIRRTVKMRRGIMHEHIPALVQHRQEVSTWDGPLHFTSTFSREWRAGSMVDPSSSCPATI